MASVSGLCKICVPEHLLFSFRFYTPSHVICWIYFRAHALTFGIWKWCYMALNLVCHSCKISKRHETFSVSVDRCRKPLQLVFQSVILHHLELGYRLGSMVTDHLFILYFEFSLCISRVNLLRIFCISFTVE